MAIVAASSKWWPCATDPWPFEPKIHRLWHGVEDYYCDKFQIIAVGFLFYHANIHTHTHTHILTKWLQYPHHRLLHIKNITVTWLNWRCHIQFMWVCMIAWCYQALHFQLIENLISWCNYCELRLIHSMWLSDNEHFYLYLIDKNRSWICSSLAFNFFTLSSFTSKSGLNSTKHDADFFLERLV